MTLLKTAVQGFRASVTLDNINLSQDYGGGRSGSRIASGGRIDLVGNKHATYEMLYQTQPWVHAGVNRIARGIGRLPWAAYMNAEQEGERERQRQGPLAELLERPFLYGKARPGRQRAGTPSLFKQAVLTNLLVHGNFVVPKVRPGVGRPPSELPPSSFAFWEIIADGEEVLWYVFHGAGGAKVPFRPDEVMHFRPYGVGRGTYADSAMEALRRTLMLEDATQRTVIAAFENGARPIGAYSVDVQLQDQTAKRLRAQLNETYGGADNFYKIMLLEGGAKWQDMSTNFVDSELAKIRMLNREEVAAVLNTPPPTIGILDHATFSNVTEQHLMEYQDTYGVWTTLIEETFQNELIDLEPTMSGQYVEFNYKEVLRGDPVKELEVGVKAVGGPIMTADEFRATQNLPPMGGDAARLNPSPTTPGGTAAGEEED